ncbi:MAG: UDP-N-acetylmuramate dehydrogenase [Sphingobacteriia bacterium]|nr:UDP-N-acetylmuramate dehydrogenase [Sphingobacteriia bacterium]
MTFTNSEELNLPEVKGTYRFNADLSPTNWFRVGGKAKILFRPYDVKDLANFIKNKPADLNIYILGVGSNIIIRDKGIDGVVIKLGKEFCTIEHDENSLITGAGTLDYNVSMYALNNELGGFEFLSGIPGTIGGGIKMNAGAYGSDISERLIKAEYVDEKGDIRIIENKDFGFYYRGSQISENYIFTKAWFSYYRDTKENISLKIKNIADKRNATQPIRSRTGGSTFKNTEKYKAWELIDKAGCRGLRIGDAQVSELHCNFLINHGKATAEDIENLGEVVRQKVFENSGIKLEWEIKIIGDK